MGEMRCVATDGHTVLGAGSDGALRVWKTSDVSASVASAAATGEMDGKAGEIHGSGGAVLEEVQTLSDASAASVLSMDVCAGGSLIAIGCEDGSIRFFAPQG